MRGMAFLLREPKRSTPAFSTARAQLNRSDPRSEQQRGYHLVLQTPPATAVEIRAVMTLGPR